MASSIQAQQPITYPNYGTVPSTNSAVNIQIIEPKNIAQPMYSDKPIYNYPTAQAYPAPYIPATKTVKPVPVAASNPVVPQSVIDANPIPVPPPANPVAPESKVEIVPPSSLPVTDADLAVINKGLKSSNFDDQTMVIQKIAELVQTEPKKAELLLNEETFGNLVDFISKDNSALSPSDKEKAETNKQYATYSLALLQKLFREQADGIATQQNIPAITINNLPGMGAVIKNIKENPNPAIREAGIKAITSLAKPEDKEILTTLLKIVAEKDPDNSVKTLASEQLASL
jgi:hypothetical protein